MRDRSAAAVRSVKELSGLCPHLGACGGCATQQRPYPDQLAAKEERVRDLLRPFEGAEFRPIVPSPEVFFYRNKMEFAFGGLRDTPPLLGLRQRGKFDRIVDLTECRLLSPEVAPLLVAVRSWAIQEKVPTYHLKSHRGFLRYLVVREGKNTGQRMVCLVTAEGPLPQESFQQAVRSSGVRVDTLVWMVNAGLSDVAWGQERCVLFGPGWIEEKIGPHRFQVSPSTFFQTNTRGAERLYELIRSGVGEVETLFDLYCGAGSIGLFCADRVSQVIGVERNPQAVEDARKNALQRGIAHAQFHAMDVKEFCQSPVFRERWGRPGAVAVLDPPRPGLQNEARRLLLEHPLRRWMYVSCHPEALAQDLALLKAVYQVKAVQPVDLFPHTPHVEVLVQLQQRELFC